MADPQIQALTIELGNLSRAIREMVTASSAALKAQMKATEAQEEQIDNIEDFNESLVKGRKLSKDQQILAKQANELKKKEIEATLEYNRLVKINNEIQKDITKSDQDRLKAQNDVSDASVKLKDAQTSTSKASVDVKNSFGELSKGSKLASVGLVWFGAALQKAISHAKDQVIANQGMIEGTGNLIGTLEHQQIQALKFGMSGADFAKTMSANRQMTNAMGGTAHVTEQVQFSMLSFYMMTGSHAAAFEALTDSMTSFALKGVAPSQKVLEQYTSDVQTLAMQTGMNEKTIRALYDDVASDSDSMDILRSARADERETILANQRAMIQHSIATGMSTEQAKLAAKTLNQLAGAKPIDRLKQAAKIRAISGALGIEGGEEAAQAVIAGKRMTAEQKQNLSTWAVKAAEVSSAAGTDTLGTEIFTTTLLEKLDLEKYLGKDSPFNNVLGSTMASSVAELKERYTDVSKNTGAAYAAQADLIKKQAELIITGNNFLGVIAAGVTALTGLLLPTKLMSTVLGNIGKAGGAVAEGVAGAATASTKAGPMSKAVTVLGKSAKFLGPIGVVAAGGYEAYDEYQTTGKTGTSAGKGVGTIGGALTGAAAGAALGTLVLPGIGTAIGALMFGVGGGLLGGQAGGKVGSNFDPTTPTMITPKEEHSPVEPHANNSELTSAVVTTSTGITTQLTKMDTSNELLKKLQEASIKHTELLEKQLAALLITNSTQNVNIIDKPQYMMDNKFASKYNYVNN